jgi:catechol 2,3-dioxygenase-like lactoylglutathione lyase family enzyme
MLDHVTANVADFETAKQFYEAALGPLGYSLKMEFPGAAGFGAGEAMADFWISSQEERGAADGNTLEAVCHSPG